MPRQQSKQSKDTKFRKSLGQWLAQQRERKNLSLRQLAALTPFSSSAIHTWETGHQSPNLYAFVCLCEALGRNPGASLTRILNNM
ncbi:MAG: helix-turn-helix transcriptional regulator, partial [Myxococcota bacterium]